MGVIYETRKPAGFSQTVTVYQADGVTVQPLTGWAFAAEAVVNEGDLVPVFAYTCVVTDAAAGTVSVTASSATLLAVLQTGVQLQANLLGTPSGGTPEVIAEWRHVIREALTQ